jgi:hypothetical protein
MLKDTERKLINDLPTINLICNCACIIIEFAIRFLISNKYDSKAPIADSLWYNSWQKKYKR